MKTASLVIQAGLWLFGAALLLPLSTQASTHTSSDIQRGTLLLSAIEQENINSTSEFDSPLLNTQVSMQVSGLLARVTLTQEFHNPGENWVNGRYLFPLPADSAVDQLRMQIGERVIIGEIQPKEAAKQTFERAKRAGKKASLLQQQRPNMFSTRLANIAPGESIRVTIEYQQQVQYRDGKFSLRFPMAITPRYLPGVPVQGEFSASGWVAGSEEITAPLQGADEVPHAVTLTAHIQSGVPVARIVSRYHAIDSALLSNTEFKITLDKQALANKDFVLDWWPEVDAEPKAALFNQHYQGQEYGLLMLLPPQPDVLPDPLPREVIFVLDTSGSMEGQSIIQAKQALTYAIEQLTHNDYFNVIEFNSDAQALWHSARPADAASKASAIAFVRGLQADGGTEMRKALELALYDNDYQNQQQVRQILFITDGSVGNEAQLMQQIEHSLGRSRLFPIGIGSAPNSYFMQEAARVGKGSFVYINDARQVALRLTPFLEKLQRPAIANLHAEFSHPVQAYPDPLGDLYAGEPLLLSFKADAMPDYVKVSGNTGSDTWAIKVPMQKSALQSGLHVRWARNKIADLHRARQLGGDAEQLKQAIIDTAMAHHLVSPFTSLVAVEQHVSRPDDAVSADKRIATNRPAGMAHGQLPQTATLAGWYAQWGWLMLGGALCLLLIAKRQA